ncbi:MAG: PDZ domain-containing protein [Gammaproteobacteria bacterium]|nr:PDZ domain-containing protein [Gammaproteobacteria bacterium]
MPEGIVYRLRLERPQAHLFSVSLEIATPAAAGQIVSLPAWIPGSYMIRDFARNVVGISAHSDGESVAITKLDKQTWRCAACQGPLRIDYEVYANDLSVRGAHFDNTRAFFNGTSVFLKVHGQEQAGHVVELDGCECATWEVATTMQALDAQPWGFGTYHAADYDELIDHPTEIGTFRRIDFSARGVPHTLVLTGHAAYDEARLGAALARVCEQHIDMFGTPAPMQRYLFLALVLDDGYGGLEHRASSSLHVARDSLPLTETAAHDERYVEFLGLVSHEYFHTWNVKRIKPAAFVPFDLSRETYTQLLWAFEGVTSYYDDLALARCGLIDRSEYLKLLARVISRVHRGAGRLRQSVAESSFDAWTKFYKQDENAPNAIVSYYAKGALVALALDLKLRLITTGRHSLDDLMRTLWKDYRETGAGIGENDIQRIAEELAGESLSEFFALAVHGTQDLPLAELLADFGVEMQWYAAQNEDDKGGAWCDEPGVRHSLGLRLRDEGGRCLITHVLEGGAAQAGGLSAGDQLLALHGLRITADNYRKRLERLPRDAPIQATVFRRDELLQLSVIVRLRSDDTCALRITANASAAQRERLAAWLPS